MSAKALVASIDDVEVIRPPTQIERRHQLPEGELPVQVQLFNHERFGRGLVSAVDLSIAAPTSLLSLDVRVLGPICRDLITYHGGLEQIDHTPVSRIR